jgi:hypothetical protein
LRPCCEESNQNIGHCEHQHAHARHIPNPLHLSTTRRTPASHRSLVKIQPARLVKIQSARTRVTYRDERELDSPRCSPSSPRLPP